MTVIISGLVEGLVDEAVLARLIQEAGGVLGDVYGKKGKDYLLQNVGRYNHAAARLPWAVLVDLDQDAPCAPSFREMSLPRPAELMCFRIAVPECEAWLLADHQALAAFVQVPAKKVPQQPEALADPKQALINLARKSASRAVRKDMVPRPGSGASEGPAYTDRLLEFVRDHWRPEIAATRAESLRRCRSRLQELVKKLA
jgi:hypothetical protein